MQGNSLKDSSISSEVTIKGITAAASDGPIEVVDACAIDMPARQTDAPAASAADTLSDCCAKAVTASVSAAPIPLQDLAFPPLPEARGHLVQQTGRQPLQDIGAAPQPTQDFGGSPHPAPCASLGQQTEPCQLQESATAFQPAALVCLIQHTGRLPLQDPLVAPQPEARTSHGQQTKQHPQQDPAAAPQTAAPQTAASVPLGQQRERQPLEELSLNQQPSQEAKSSADADEEKEVEEVHDSLKGMCQWPTPAAASASAKGKVGGQLTECCVRRFSLFIKHSAVKACDQQSSVSIGCLLLHGEFNTIWPTDSNPVHHLQITVCYFRNVPTDDTGPKGETLNACGV